MNDPGNFLRRRNGNIIKGMGIGKGDVSGLISMYGKTMLTLPIDIKAVNSLNV